MSAKESGLLVSVSKMIGNAAEGKEAMGAKSALRLPTPLASDGAKGGPNQRGAKGDLRLPSAVLRLPTPRASANENRQTKLTPSQMKGEHGMSLCAALNALVLRLPTPTACSGKGSSPAALTRRDGKDRTGDRLDHSMMAMALRFPTPCAMEPAKNLAAHDAKRARPRSERGGGNAENLGTVVSRGVSGGQLNPEFVEWLMGWPVGWTGLDALGMDRWRRWRGLHGAFFRRGCARAEAGTEAKATRESRSTGVKGGSDE